MLQQWQKFSEKMLKLVSW